MLSAMERFILRHNAEAYLSQLEVYTSHIKYNKPDRLDITVKSGISIFAPTWDLVNNYQTNKITQDEFIGQYIKLLNGSYSEYKTVWDSLMSKTRVTLVCYCKPDKFCHRQILAEYLQQRFEARYIGEIVGDYVIF